MNDRTKSGLLWIAAATTVFVAALVVFCWSLGLNFRDEGWPDASGETHTIGLALSSVSFVVSIVMFFLGVQRVA